MAKKKKNRPVEVEEPVRTIRKLKVGRPYVVKLKHNDPRVVVAKTEEGAWNKYKKLMGIRFTEHEPKIVKAPDDMEYDAETGKITKDGTASAPEDEEDDFDTVPDDEEEDEDE